MSSWAQERRDFLKRIPQLTGATLLAAALRQFANSQEKPPLHAFAFAASFKGDLYYPAIVAEQEGYYRDEQIAVEINYGFGGGDSLRLVAAGRLPVNCAEAGESVTLARSKGANVSLVCTYMVGDSNSLISRPSVKSYRDLPSEVLLGVSLSLIHI